MRCFDCLLIGIACLLMGTLPAAAATFVVDSTVDTVDTNPGDGVCATAAGACMLTIMGILAQRHAINLRGATVSVGKEMITQPERRIGKLCITIRVPAHLPEAQQKMLERGAMTCPVHKSLHPDIELPVKFEWATE